jgi:hypothetical protein
MDAVQERSVMLDPFEARCRQMAECTAEERRVMIEEMRARCICPTCPTYTDCAKNNNELLFCDMGYSYMCIKFEVECLCPTCPVHDDLKMKHNFYCMRGAEKAQRYEKEVWGIQF